MFEAYVDRACGQNLAVKNSFKGFVKRGGVLIKGQLFCYDLYIDSWMIGCVNINKYKIIH